MFKKKRRILIYDLISDLVEVSVGNISIKINRTPICQEQAVKQLYRFIFADESFFGGRKWRHKRKSGNSI